MNRKAVISVEKVKRGESAGVERSSALSIPFRHSPVWALMKFFTVALALFALLDLAWRGLPFVQDGYAAMYRTTGNLFFSRIGANRFVTFRAKPRDAETLDTETEFGKLAPPTSIPGPESSSLRQGYLSVAALAAMILATPVPRRRRLIALPVGLVIIQAYVAFRLGLMVLHWFAQPTPVRCFELSAFWHEALALLRRAIWDSPAGALFMPPLIWALVCIRRNDLRAFIEPHPVRDGDSPRLDPSVRRSPATSRPGRGGSGPTPPPREAPRYNGS